MRSQSGGLLSAGVQSLLQTYKFVWFAVIVMILGVGLVNFRQAAFLLSSFSVVLVLMVRLGVLRSEHRFTRYALASVVIAVIVGYLVDVHFSVMKQFVAQVFIDLGYLLWAACFCVVLFIIVWYLVRKSTLFGFHRTVSSSETNNVRKESGDKTGKLSGRSPRRRLNSVSSLSSSDDEEVESGEPLAPSWLINVPDERTHVTSFEGRDGCVEEVADILRKDSICSICGQAGIGKTTVAAKLVHQLKETYYDVVFWISSASEESFVESVSKISDEISIKSSYRYKYSAADAREATGDFHVDEKMKAVKHWIDLNSDELKILLVFDGCEELSFFTKVHKLLPERRLSDRKLHVLVTSKLKRLESIRIYRTYTLEPLSADVVVKLLKDRARASGVKWKVWDDDVETNAAKKINELVGGVPLAVEQVTAFIHMRKLKISQYLKEYNKCELMPVEPPVHGNQQSDMYQVYERNFQETSKDPCVREIMGIVAFCGVGHPIPMQLFSLGSEGLQERYALRKLVDDLSKNAGVLQREDSLHVPLPFFNLVSELEQYHLVNLDTDNETFSIHPLIQHLLLTRQEPEDKTESIAALSVMLAKVLEGSPSDRWQLYGKLFPHVMECYRRMNKMNVFDINFLLQTGKGLALSGHFQESSQLLEECLSKMQQNVREHRTMNEGEALLALGSAKRRLGKFSDAIRCTHQALNVWKSLPLSPRISKLQARTTELRAEIHLDLDEFSLAEKMLKEVEPLIVCSADSTEGSLTPDIYEQASCLGNLGRAYFGQGKYDEAEEMFQRAEDVLQEAKYFRFHLYKAHRLVTTARKALEKRDADLYRRMFKHCRRTLEEIENHYNVRHRYYSWLCREVSVLRLTEVTTIARADNKTRKMQLAFEMCKRSLESHLELYKESHQKVAKAAEVTARVCLEYSKCDGISRDKSREYSVATVRCLQLAVRIWRDIQNEIGDNLTEILKKKITELQDLETETRHRVSVNDDDTKARFLTLPEHSITEDEIHNTHYLAENAVQAVHVVSRESGSSDVSMNQTAADFDIVFSVFVVICFVALSIVLLERFVS